LLYKWELKGAKGGSVPPYVFNWAKKLNISSFLARILWQRGLTSLDEMAIFLSPNLRHLKSLDSVKGLLDGAKFVARQLKAGKKIAIWGDYDVDGITSIYILVDLLKKKGFCPIYYIPERTKEGYGLNIEGLKRLISKNVECLVTVDCGISNIEEIKWLREKGVNVIVTDHHMPSDTLPEANFVINPKLGSKGYYNVAGVGVAFLFGAALNKELPHPVDMREYLDLVAIGTIADMVPMDIDNRILVKNGLLILSESKRPGIVALKEVSGINHGSYVGAEEVGYVLAPRINAAGRMSKGIEGVELLLCDDLEEARKMARRLEEYNRERKKEEEKILKQAMEIAAMKSHLPGLVLYSDNWHEGIIGIVASRICEKFYKPTFLLTGKNGVVKGSGRSIPEVDLYKVLKRCHFLLIKYGGHPQAGGISVHPENIEDFEQVFVRAIEEFLEDKVPTPTLNIEADLSLDKISYNLIKELQLLEPFGPNNPEPLFCSNGLRVTKHKVIGDAHVFLELRDEKAKKTMWGKAWKMADIIPEDVLGREVTVAFYPKLSIYNGLIGIELQLKDIKLKS